MNGKNRVWIRCTLLVVVIVLIPLLGACAPKPKTYQVGILCGSDAFLEVVAGFKAGMANLGYVEGENVIYDMQALNADPTGEQHAAERFVSNKVDLIFAVPTEPAVAAQAATRETGIPVVFAYAGIENSGLVNSVREPGGNITGVRFPGPEQISKRLEILLELAPQVRRVWIGYDRNYPNTSPALEALRPLAASRGVTLVEVPATTLEELEADLASRAAKEDIGIDAIILMPDIFNHSPDGWALIRGFAAQHRVPVAGSFLYTVEQGAVFGNANDLVRVGELAAPLADKILKGAPAGTIPVVTPDQALYINYKVAQQLGLTVSEGLLGQADEVIR